MRHFVFTLMSLLFLSSKVALSAPFADTSLTLFNGEKKTLKELGTAPYLFVNIATQCGYTGQLKDLEALHQKYKAKGVTVIGIPSNDFGGQSPESNSDIGAFCQKNYGVTFPILEKAVVLGEKKIDLIKNLLTQGDKSEIKWNFEKFLVDASGKLLQRFKSSVDPMESKLTKAIDSALTK
jgi:glutathione peroxidase-family protein